MLTANIPSLQHALLLGINDSLMLHCLTLAVLAGLILSFLSSGGACVRQSEMLEEAERKKHNHATNDSRSLIAFIREGSLRR